MKNIVRISLIVCCTLLYHSNVSSQGFSWLNEISSPVTGANYYGSNIVAVTYGNDSSAYITGHFRGTVSFGGISLTAIPGSVAANDIFIAKVSSTGQVLWAKQAGGSGYDYGIDIAVDNMGGVYVSGAFSYSATFDTITVQTAVITGYNPLLENFLAKYDTAGNIQWIKHGSRANQYYGYYGYNGLYGDSQLEFKNGFLYYAPSYSVSATDSVSVRTFDGNVLPFTTGYGYNYSSTNSFVLKTDPSGSNSWIRPILTLNGTYGFVVSFGMAIKSNDNVILKARVNQSWKVDTTSFVYLPGPNSYGYERSVILELDTSGNYLNSFVFDSLGQNYNLLSNGLAIDDSDNVYCLNNSLNGGSNEVIAGTLIPPSGQFITKLSSGLNPLHVSIIGGNQFWYTGLRTMKITGSEIILGGTVNGSINLGGNTLTLTNECFFASIDTSFNSLNWYTNSVSSYPSTSYNYWYINQVTDLALGEEDEYYFTGIAGNWSTSFGDYSVTNNSSRDGYLTKIVKCYPLDLSVSPLNPIICGLGSSTQLDASFNSGLDHNWVSSGAAITGATNSFYLANNPGPYSFAADSLGCKDTSNVVNVVVSTPPVVTVPTGVLTVCSTAPPIVLPGGTPAGGTWSGTGVVNDTLFNPSLAGMGPVILTYSFSNTDSCSSSTVRTINVVAPPALLVSGSLPTFCDNDSPYGLGGIVYPGGGVYSGVGISSNIFDPITAGPGTHVVTYTYTAIFGCAITTNFNVVVNVSPTINYPTFAPVCESVNNLFLNSATPTGGTYTGLNTWNNVFYPSIAGPGSYSITYTVSQNGCTSSNASNIQVDSVPAAILLPVGPFCLNDTSVTLTEGSPTGGDYYVNGQITTQISPTTLGVGIHSLSYIYTNSCGQDTVTQNFEIFSIPNVAIASVGPFCDNEPNMVLTQGTPFGGVYSGLGVSGGTFYPNVAPTGTNTLYYSFSDSNNCSVTDSISVIVNPKPNINITADSVVCDGYSPIPLSVTPVGGVWTGSTGIIGNLFDPQGLPVGSDTLQYLFTDINNCSDTAYHTMHIAPIPVVSLSSFAPICNNSSAPILLSGGTPTGGTYTGVGVTSNIFNPSVAGTGIHLITYTYSDSNNCSSFDSSILVVDTTAIAITLNSFSNVCADASPITLTGGNPTGGVYSGIGTANGVFDPSTNGAGAYTIYYSYAAPNSCLTTKSQTIQVDSLPNVTFSALTDACSSDTAFSLSTGTPIGGIYSGIGVSSNIFNAQIANIGTHTLAYTFTDGNGCLSSDTQTVTVNPIPNVSMANLANTCLNSGNVLLTGGLPTGGVYSGSGVTGATFNPLVSGMGSHIITYTFTDSNSCVNSVFDTLTVNNATSNLSTFSDMCEGDSSITLSGGSPIGGLYSGTGVSGSQFDPITAGSGNFDIVYTIYANGCVASDTQQIQVNALPFTASNNLAILCESDTAHVLFTGVPSGGVYLGPGITGNVFNASVSGTGTNYFTYTYTDTNSCQNTVVDSIVVNGLPSVNIPDFGNLCLNDSAILLTGGLPANGFYFGFGVSSGYFNPLVADTGMHYISYSYMDSNSCIGVAIDTIEVLVLPTISFALADSICAGATPLNLTGGSPSGGSYAGTAVASSMFTPSIAGVGNFDLSYTYLGINGCTSSDTQSIEVLSTPVISLPPFANICVNDSQLVLSGGIPNGGIYSGIGVNSGVFYPDSAGLGTYPLSYSYIDTNGCSNSASSNITVNPFLQPWFPVPNDICEDALPLNLTTATPTGGVYSGFGVSNGQFNPSITGAGMQSITYSFTIGNGCVGDSTVSIMVNGIPVVSNPYDDTICMNTGIINLTGGTPVGGVFSGSPVTNNSFDPAMNGLGTFNFIYSYTDSLSCSNADTGWITVLDYPIVNAGLDQALCKGSSTILTVFGANSYQWSTGSLVDTTHITPDTTTSYSVIGTNTYGCSSIDTVIVTVNPNPEVDFGLLDTLCADSVITVDGGFGYSNYNWSTSETTRFIDIGPYSSGGYVSVSLIVTDSVGCIGQGTLGLRVVNCGPTGIITLENETSVKVYPNPNNGNFTIQINDWKESDMELSIISVTGSLVFHERIDNLSSKYAKQMEVSSIADGVYWIIIKGATTIHRERIIIAK